MASNDTATARPRTPSPPRYNHSHRHADSTDAASFHSMSPPSIKTHYDYDIREGISDSPRRAPDAATMESTAQMLSPGNALYSNSAAMSSQGSLFGPYTPPTPGMEGSFGGHEASAGAVHNPFNFTTVQYTAATQSTMAKSSEAMGKRRGHKYRHSSIHASHMDSLFKPSPSTRAPLSVPASLPMPTKMEAWWSMNRNQTLRLAWCACHFFVAAYVQFCGGDSLAMTALSRLLLFDAAGATVCVVVDVMGNFEVWKRSSIKHPFGLERADVLAGFGMAVFIAFMGLDVISHGIQHSLENLGAHEPHTAHEHARVSARSVDAAGLLAIASTLVSAVLLQNHARIANALRGGDLPPAGWRRILANPSHVLTLSCSALLLVLPLLPASAYDLFDKALSFVIAGLMIALGVRLGAGLASMLLMSFGASAAGNRHAVRDVIAAIARADPAVTNVDDARFWQVHYGLCMANLKLRYRASSGSYGLGGDDVTRIRQKVASLIRQRLGGTKWDISVQLALETDR